VCLWSDKCRSTGEEIGKFYLQMERYYLRVGKMKNGKIVTIGLIGILVLVLAASGCTNQSNNSSKSNNSSNIPSISFRGIVPSTEHSY
jgi:hypothetical protein